MPSTNLSMYIKIGTNPFTNQQQQHVFVVLNDDIATYLCVQRNTRSAPWSPCLSRAYWVVGSNLSPLIGEKQK